MIKNVNHNAMAIAGYTVPWSAAPSKKVDVHLSSLSAINHTAIYRIDTPQREAQDWPIKQCVDHTQTQTIEQGSYLSIAPEELSHLQEINGLSFELYLTRNSATRCILSLDSLQLELENSHLSITMKGQTQRISSSIPANTWLTLSLNNQGNSVQLKLSSVDVLAPYHLHHTIEEANIGNNEKHFMLGWNGQNNQATLNAKFANITLNTSQGIAHWQFPTRLGGNTIACKGLTPSVSLTVHNSPTFCLSSLRWDGTSYDPKQAPQHYDAIHCHDDDMPALDWPVSYEFTVPDNAEAGVYAFQAHCDSGTEDIVFFVASTRATAPLVFLAPTATYLAYADEVLPEQHFPWQCEDRGHRFAVDNNLRSLYDYHSDLSGVSLCSYKKPKGMLREDYLYPLCAAPHNLPVDLHFLRFCHTHNIAFDLITDHDLHEQGLACLTNYQAVMTGSHPEYMSIEMEQALRDFAAQGGSIAYMGGNGFAATVAIKDDLMELRRSSLEAGRTWDGSVADQTMAINNEPGGLLRNRGRGEHSLIGGAISLMGFDQAQPFTRTQASYNEECAWLFNGMEKDTFGSDGIVLGGAAGYEVDATDHHLGTSPDTIIIAQASGFNEHFFQDITRWYEGGITELLSRRCAEMTIRFLSNGGLIFSASSVAWCGALPANEQINDVGRLTLNLLQRLSQT